MKKLLFLLFFLIFGAIFTTTLSAQGYGSDTSGGNNGTRLLVTSLEDHGPGTLREALENQSGARTIVFSKSGTITLQEPIVIRNPFVTIDGSTAPDHGITLRQNGLIIATHDVIVTNLRIRIGDEGGPTNNRDGINISTTLASGDVYNILIDHCSISWGIDENISTWVAHNKTHTIHDVTIRYSIISEGLFNSIHVDEGAPATVTDAHSMGGLFGPDNSYNISFHHNLLAHNDGRNPRIVGINKFELVNNVIYNWGSRPVEFGPSTTITAHVIGNYFKGGANSTRRDIKFDDGITDASRIFIDNNFADFGKNRSLDTTKIRSPQNDQHAVILQQNSGNVVSWYTNSPPPFKASSFTFTPTLTAASAHDAYQTVLAQAGAWPRDSVDQRIVNNTINRTGKIIDSQEDVGGWPEYQASEGTFQTASPTPAPRSPDLNGDGHVNDTDVEMFKKDFGKTGDPEHILSDLNNDGVVDIYDYSLLVEQYGQ